METKLRAELESIRAARAHAVNKGNKAELAFRTFLNDHLPRSFEVGHGEAIDVHGNEAGNIGRWRPPDRCPDYRRLPSQIWQNRRTQHLFY
ncbi:DUF6602 domain-containing protein [Agrobacterium cavarae]|uniref:DUF6602 domain-containing protein n=1 Tax=Agrobacterium cavarae TaxID=2528239 RepID=UPI003FD51951